MGRVSTLQDMERRDKIEELWAKGERSFQKIASFVGCEKHTVSRDLIFIRRTFRNRLKKEKHLEFIRLEEDRALLHSINHIHTQITSCDNSMAKVGFVKALLQARRQRAELWGLIGPYGTNISVNAQASAGDTTINTPHAVIFSSVKDECQVPNH